MSKQQDDAVAGKAMIVPVAHPVLRDITEECLRTFKSAREEYVRVMKDHPKARSTAGPVSLKSSIQPSLLAGLVQLREFKDVANVASLTDEDVEDWIDSQLAPEADELVPLKDVANAVLRGVRRDT